MEFEGEKRRGMLPIGKSGSASEGGARKGRRHFLFSALSAGGYYCCY